MVWNGNGFILYLRFVFNGYLSISQPSTHAPEQLCVVIVMLTTWFRLSSILLLDCFCHTQKMARSTLTLDLE